MKVLDKAVVLLSSGLDSTVNLYQAKSEMEIALALSFDYGQRAGAKEIEKAKKQCLDLGVPHKVLKIDWIKEFGQSSLLDESLTVPTGADVQIDSLERSQKTMQSVWVPNRNGIFLNIAAGFAEALGARYIIPGFNLEEAATFPDNSLPYMESLDQAFSFSTRNHVQVKCYTVMLSKPQIAKKAIELKVNWDHVWPCYFAFEKWCGECESCQRSKRALLAAGVEVKKLFLK